jgi:hypothetical protein
MRTAEQNLDSLAEIDRRIGLMATAEGTAGIVNAVRDYLACWPRERILGVQKVDGGWGPFDARQQPVTVRGPDHIVVIAESMRRQRDALSAAGMAPTPEFLEIDLFFFLARQVVENWKRQKSEAPALGPTGGGYRHWSDARSTAGRDQ